MGKNIIQQEYELAKTKMFEEEIFKDNTLVRITSDNVALAEAMIRNDSAYIKLFNANAKPRTKYMGSSAYWWSQMKLYMSGVERDKKTYRNIIKNLVEAIDRENSTHLNADRCGRKDITDRLCGISLDELVNYLKNPVETNYWIFFEISKRTSSKHRSRINPSFASKFCHYACYYLFEGRDEQDNYPIYDSVIRTVLPVYLERFEIKSDYRLNDYMDYVKAVDAILSAVKEREKTQISRNGLDQLLWYYYKARI